MQRDISEYSLKISGLSEGLHEFRYSLASDFFFRFDEEIVLGACMSVDMRLEKMNSMMKLGFHFVGEVEIPCGRCLEVVHYPLDFEKKVLVRFQAESEETEDDDLWIVSEKEHQLNVAEFLYESVVLELPMQVVCSDVEGGKCAQEMVEHLDKLMVQAEEEVQIDPRWDALRKLQEKNIDSN